MHGNEQDASDDTGQQAVCDCRVRELNDSEVKPNASELGVTYINIPPHPTPDPSPTSRQRYHKSAARLNARSRAHSPLIRLPWPPALQSRAADRICDLLRRQQQPQGLLSPVHHSNARRPYQVAETDLEHRAELEVVGVPSAKAC